MEIAGCFLNLRGRELLSGAIGISLPSFSAVVTPMNVIPWFHERYAGIDFNCLDVRLPGTMDPLYDKK